jgi:hypothetical protein
LTAIGRVAGRRAHLGKEALMNRNAIRFCLAAAAAAAFAMSAAAADPTIFTFHAPDDALGHTPTNAWLWADDGNWQTDGTGAPLTAGSAADISTEGNGTVRYLLLPEGDLYLGGVKGTVNKNYYIIGDVLHMDSSGYSGSTPVAAGRLNPGLTSRIYASMVYPKEASGTFTVAGDFKLLTSGSKVTLSVGSIAHRADLYANNSNPLRERDLDIDYVYQGTGNMRFTAPRSRAADTNGVWRYTSGARFIERVSGVDATTLAVGCPVEGPGIQSGTFLKRIFAYNWIELSQPTTSASSPGGETVTFRAFFPRSRNYIRLQQANNGHQSNGIYLSQYAQNDDYRLDIAKLEISKGDGTYFPFLVEDPSTQFPATLVLHDTTAVRDRLRFDMAHLELSPDVTDQFFMKAYYLYFNNASSYARITVTGDCSVTMHTFTNILGRLVKDGTGALATGVDSAVNNGYAVVEDGRLTLTNSTPGLATLGKLTIAAGATFALAENSRFVVSALDAASGAAIHLAAGSELRLPIGARLAAGVAVTGPGMVTCQMPTGGEAALLSTPEGRVVGNPAFWIDACSLTNATPSGALEADGDNVRVARWDDCRGGEAAGYMFCTNIVLKPKLVAGATPYVDLPYCNNNAANISAFAWNKPLTNIRAVFAVLTAAPTTRCGGILGATRRVSNPDFLRGGVYESHLFYVCSNDHVIYAPIYIDGIEKIYTEEKLNEGRAVLVEVHPTANAQADAFGITDAQSPGWAQSRWDLCAGGRVHEYIIYTNTLTYAERVAVADYLMTKWTGRHIVHKAADAAHRAGAISSGGCESLSVDVPEGGSTVADSVAGAFSKTGEGSLTVLDSAVSNIHVQAGELVLVSRDPLDKTKLPSAYLHLDASAEDTFEWTTTADNVKRVKTWRAASAGSMSATLRVSSSTNAPTVKNVAALGGMPVVDFGIAATTNSWNQNFNPTLSFSGTRNLQAIFAVHGSAGGGNTLLGGTAGRNDNPATSMLGLWRNVQTYVGDKTRPIIETTNGSYGNNMADFIDLAKTEVREDGVVVNQATKGFTGGYCVYALKTSGKMSGNLIGGIHYGQTWGGVEFGELMYLAFYPDQETFDRTEAYLQKKWFNRRTPGWTAAEAGEIVVDPGATLTVAGGSPLTARALGGGGTVSGDVILAEGGEILAVVAADGSVQGLTATGSADLSAGGTVRLAGAVDALLPGNYPLVTSASINLGSAHWTCADSLSRYSLRIVARATSLDLSVAVKGTTILFK